jgi:hypothetical protein
LPAAHDADLRSSTERLGGEAVVERVLVIDVCPSIATIRSPVFSPARAAGLFSVTVATSAPAGA